MNKPINDGGPAFPIVGLDSIHASGLSIRQWYAGMAMQAAVSNPESSAFATEQLRKGNMSFEAYCKNMVMTAFNLADAMIKHETPTRPG